MQEMSETDSFDIPFAVPFVHRLRFTHDVFGTDSNTLLDLLLPSGNQPARIQFWIDEIVLQANPWIRNSVESFVAAHPDRLRRASNLQIVPGGEEVKNDIHILERMLKVMNTADLDRRSYVVAIGGGAMLDAVGFAASIAHRGIRIVRIPTTTLAQADSGVGVKNGVNLFGKGLGRIICCPLGRHQRCKAPRNTFRPGFSLRFCRSGESVASQRSCFF